MPTVFDADDNLTHDENKLDDHHGYSISNKTFGFFHYKNNVKILLVICRNVEQQERLNKMIDRDKKTKKNDLKVNRSGIRNSKMLSSLTFSIVAHKLVWLNFYKKSITHFDMDTFMNYEGAKIYAKLAWS